MSDFPGDSGHGLEFHSKEKLYSDGMKDIYDLSKAIEKGYKILKKQYDQTNNKIYSGNADFNDLKSIMPIEKYKYNKIVFVGAPKCKFSSYDAF